jgi:hypothetical protein
MPSALTTSLIILTFAASSFVTFVFAAKASSMPFARALRFDDKPDYLYLHQLFCNLYVYKGFQYATHAPPTLTTSLLTPRIHYVGPPNT